MNLELLDIMPILHSGHTYTQAGACAPELLALVITGKSDLCNHRCITEHQHCLWMLGDGPWRDDEHRTVVMRPLLKRLIQCSPRDTEKDKAIASRLGYYINQVCLAEAVAGSGARTEVGTVAASWAEKAEELAVNIFDWMQSVEWVTWRSAEVACLAARSAQTATKVAECFERYTVAILGIICEGYGV